MKKLFTFIFIILGVVFLQAQRVDYQGGYFKKEGNKWYEYRPQEKSGVHNYFNQVDDQADWWVLDNGLCKVAIPKNPSKNNILIKMPGGDWKYKYTATSISGYSTSASKNRTSKSTAAKNTNSAKSKTNTAGRKTCELCKGSGVCTSCKGSGVSDGLMLWGKPVPCGLCGGKKTCFKCAGKGSYTDTEWAVRQQNIKDATEYAKSVRNSNSQKRNERQTTTSGSNSSGGNTKIKCRRCNGSGIDPVLIDYQPGSRTRSERIIAYHYCKYCKKERSEHHWHQKCSECYGLGYKRP